MKVLKITTTLGLFLCLFFTKALAQVQKGELLKGKTVSAEIVPKEQHRYSISLEKNQFAFFKLMQEGVDVKVTTYTPKGKKIEEFDSPNGNYGAELFALNSDEKGKYVVEVTPLEENESKGKYSITLNFVKPKALTPGDQVDELFAPWDNKDSPGAAVAVVQNGTIVYKKGYGMANLEYDIPNSPSTVFHIASVSKQFTAFSILLLEKAGKLSLDDDIRKYIPEVPDFGKTITLRHLATHTSGMRDQWNLLAMAGWRLDDVITKEQVLKLVSKQKALNFNPGEEFVYCNTGFTLLAEVVARVSGQSFAEFTQANIFSPLKMKSTLFYDDHEKIVKNRAYSYHENNSYKKSVLSYANVGATSLFTTAEDLSLWAVNFGNPVVGDSTLIRKLNTLAVLNNGKTFGGALGQFVGNYKGLNEIQHGGADAGYRSFLTRFPDEKFSVVVLSNAAEFNSGDMAHKVVDIYLKDKIKKEPVVAAKKEESPKPAGVSVDQATLNTYLGDFELQPGFNISITLNNGQLFGQATGQPAFKLTPLSNTEFTVEGVDAKVEFVPNGGEKINTLKLHQSGRIMDAPRLKGFDKNAVNLAEFSGSFYSEELSTTYDFVVVGGKLVAKHSRHSDFEIQPLKKDIFSGQAWFFGQIEFVRDAKNGITGCKVSNGRVRNLYFKKL